MSWAPYYDGSRPDGSLNCRHSTAERSSLTWSTFFGRALLAAMLTDILHATVVHSSCSSMALAAAVYAPWR
jgi:hypothetical protein